MADEEQGTWVPDDGVIQVLASGKTLSGHSFEVAAFGPAAVRGCTFTLADATDGPPMHVNLDGEDDDVALADLPEQDRTEIEAALQAAALAWVEGYLHEHWVHGWDPFLPKDEDEDDEVAA